MLIWLIALLVLAVLSLGWALYEGEPLWVGAVLFCGILGLAFGFVYVRRLMHRRRAKLLAAEQAGETNGAPAESVRADLRRSWELELKRLKRSHLASRGNPVYTLPWYLMMGSPGAGKTAAVRRARVGSALLSTDPNAPVIPTSGCEWNYLDNAIVLDLAGKYFDPQAEAVTGSEWKELLDLLSRTRRRQLLNGVVLAVSVPELLESTRDELQIKARFMRRRLAQLVRVAEVSFPTYLLVTHIDHLPGIKTLVRALPQSMLEQAMGWIAPDDSSGSVLNGSESEKLDGGRMSTGGAAEEAMAYIGDRLRELRLVLLQSARSDDLGLLVFPQELEQLKPNLEIFLDGVFGPDPYVETGVLGGIFFGSGSQQEKEGSSSAEALGEASDATNSTDSDEDSTSGYFLHDFFDKVLSADRFSTALPARKWRWDRVTRNVGFASWWLLNAAAAGVLSYSFITTFNVVQTIKQRDTDMPRMTGVLRDDLAKLGSVSNFVLWMARQHQRTYVHLAPFNGYVAQAAEPLRTQYCRDFQMFILPETTKLIDRYMATKRSSVSGPELGEFIHILMRRVNMTQARVDGAGYEQLAQMPPPDVAPLRHIEPDLPTGFEKEFARLYLVNLAWQPNVTQLAIHLDHLRRRLSNLVNKSNPDMHWLVGWSNDEPDLKKVTQAYFWPGIGAKSSNQDVVPAAYTVSGVRIIRSFLKQLKQALPHDALDLQRRSEKFWPWYHEQRLEAWYRFAAGFGPPAALGANEAAWTMAVPLVSGSRSPYYALLDRINDDFTGINPESAPAWLRLVNRFVLIKNMAEKGGLLNSRAIASAVSNSGPRLVRSALSGNPGQSIGQVSSELEAAKAFRVYSSDFRNVAGIVATNRAEAAKISSAFYSYGEDPKAGPSKLYKVYAAIDNFKQQLKRVAGNDDPVIMSVIEGPLSFLRLYTDRRTACFLQGKWKADVIWPVRGAVSRADAAKMLYGPQGLVWKFANRTAAPFIKRNANAYTPVTMKAGSVPFSQSFLAYLNEAQRKWRNAKIQSGRESLAGKQRQNQLNGKLKQIQTELAKLKPEAKQLKSALSKQQVVIVQGLPSAVNLNAQAYPYETVLSLQCSSGVTTLKNLNFPVQKRFSFSSATCGRTTLEIKIRGLVLTQTYPGHRGFVDFLDDFYDGTHTFKPAAFPSSESALKALKVRKITVQYLFTGSDTLLITYKRLKETTDRITLLENEQKSLEAQQQQSSQQTIASDRGKLQPIASRKLGLPAEAAPCWTQPVTARSVKKHTKRSPEKPHTKKIPLQLHQKS